MGSNNNQISASQSRTWIYPSYCVDKLRSGQNLSELIHRLGHDIGNPLTAIISLGSVIQTLAELESKSNTESKFPAYAASIIAEAWKVSRISERMVCILSQRKPIAAACNLENSLSEVFNRLYNRDHARYENIDIEFADSSEDLAANIDQSQLNLFFTELIINAVEGIERRLTENNNLSSQIYVRIFKEDNLACITIGSYSARKNTLDLIDLFNPFVSGFPEEKHVGIGLTTCYAIAQGHGGQIAISEESKDNGYYFTVKVCLPM
ncbi:MAG: HAMP domain-containing histidine kinase [Deltaproteobacteria bacterium]|nr:HAMP domain-containing histidine kinase [Deltaproteobacteria bacterium]